MRKLSEREEFHDIYPEFNEAYERMLTHKERSGAKAVAAVLQAAPALALVAAFACLLLLQSVSVSFRLDAVTPVSAQAEVQSDLSFSNYKYPIYYRLYPIEQILAHEDDTREQPPAERYALGAPVRTGELTKRTERLSFSGLSEGRS